MAPVPQASMRSTTDFVHSDTLSPCFIRKRSQPLSIWKSSFAGRGMYICIFVIINNPGGKKYQCAVRVLTHANGGLCSDEYETRRERQRQGVQLAKAAGKYAGRKSDVTTHQRIIALRQAGQTIERTAMLAGCSVSQVKRIWAIYQSSC